MSTIFGSLIKDGGVKFVSFGSSQTCRAGLNNPLNPNVPPAGLEPATLWSEATRSIRLSYGGKKRKKGVFNITENTISSTFFHWGVSIGGSDPPMEKHKTQNPKHK